MKCMPQSQLSCSGSRFLDNLCAQQYWNFKLLPQTCGVPVLFHKTSICLLVFSCGRSLCASFNLVYGRCPHLFSVSSWWVLMCRGCVSLEGLISWGNRWIENRTSFPCSHHKSFVLPEWDTCAQLCFVGDTRTKPTIETHTTRNTLSPVSTPLHVHKILCVGSFNSYYCWTHLAENPHTLPQILFWKTCFIMVCVSDFFGLQFYNVNAGLPVQGFVSMIKLLINSLCL